DSAAVRLRSPLSTVPGGGSRPRVSATLATTIFGRRFAVALDQHLISEPEGLRLRIVGCDQTPFHCAVNKERARGPLQETVRWGGPYVLYSSQEGRKRAGLGCSDRGRAEMCGGILWPLRH